MTEENNRTPRNFLGILFECCGVYGRIYQNKDSTAYVGRCPKCMRNIKVPIGKNGTDQRFFRGK